MFSRKCSGVPIRCALLPAAAAAALMLPSDTRAGTVLYRADLQTLNAAYGSTAKGTANFTLNDDDPMNPTLRVQVNATGLQDFSAVPGAVHLAHIHGQFAGNRAQPLPQQLDGPFFSGEGGTTDSPTPPINSTVPTAADDGGRLVDEPARGLGPRFLDFFEGLPDYGPVVQNLSSRQLPAPPSGVSPSTDFVNKVVAGAINPEELFPKGTSFILDTTYTYDLSDPDQQRQYYNTVGDGGQVLTQRVVVLHGLTVPTEISDAIDMAAGVPAGHPQAGVPLPDDISFRLVAPVAAGDIAVVPLPPAALAALPVFAVLGGKSWLRRRKLAKE